MADFIKSKEQNSWEKDYDQEDSSYSEETNALQNSSITLKMRKEEGPSKDENFEHSEGPLDAVEQEILLTYITSALTNTIRVVRIFVQAPGSIKAISLPYQDY